jgi:hypothetical protein
MSISLFEKRFQLIKNLLERKYAGLRPTERGKKPNATKKILDMEPAGVSFRAGQAPLSYRRACHGIRVTGGLPVLHTT